MSPDLRIVPLDSIKLQEGVTDEKASSLAANMRKRNEIINPVVVAPLSEQRFVQLDGASRTVALSIIGAPWSFVHVVPYESVAVTTWVHTTRMDSSALHRLDDTDQNIRLSEAGGSIDGFELVATAMFAEGDHFGIHSSGGLIKRVQVANQLIGLYQLRPEQRVDTDGDGIARALQAAHALGPDGVTIEFSPFSQSEILCIVERGELLPPGVTKHRLNQRIIMNYPLNLLLDDRLTQEEQNAILAKALDGIKFHPYRDQVVLQAEPWG